MASRAIQDRIQTLVGQLNLREGQDRDEVVELFSTLVEGVMGEIMEELKDELKDEIEIEVDKVLDMIDFDDKVESALHGLNLMDFVKDHELEEKLEELGYLANAASKTDLAEVAKAVGELESLRARGFWGRLRWIFTGR